MENVLRITKNVAIPLAEIEFRSARSGGPGGQHVNKVETKIELLFDVQRSEGLNDEQRALILSQLANRIDADGQLTISSQETRSQFQNKQRAIEKFVALMRQALTPRKSRRATKPTRTSKERRLESKRKRSSVKRERSSSTKGEW